jgi:hypothetical protein
MKNLTLKIVNKDTTLFSVPHCTQELTHIPQGTFMRTLAGSMVFTGGASDYKYRTLIKGQGQEPPAFEGMYRGRQVTVHCIQYLAQRVSRGVNEVTLARPCVQGSVAVLDTLRRPLPHTLIDDRHVRLTHPEGGLIQYQPRLEMLIMDLHLEAHEKQGVMHWKIVLEEV